ncbi:amidohydrolase family protein [Tepidimicrobium xylanilyticum]|uniref:amidohydrolase family protein n=1 Tax=Tepidimicrobium xylanilyticum TaxID=1123352 RepID=UPI0026522C5C|nr:amidohydrolase family protein [Tepidimicrobium xylanilyticum]GMG97774.1 metal-dependent hydrolase [Tepidimicrobium xylanilyticum]
MIIDVSNTIGKHKYKKEIKAEELIKQMDEAGVDRAVINCYPESLDNDSVFNAITMYPNRFIGLYTVNPWNDNAVDELELALREKGFKGLYMNPIRHGYMLNEYELIYLILDVCKKYSVPVWCYSAAEVFCSPILFDRIATDYPEINFILGRMGLQYDNASAVLLAKRHPNIYLETSSSMDFNAARAIKTAGIDKVLLGTGTPDAGYFELEIKKIERILKDNPNGLEQVLGGNAMRIFGIEEGR